MADFSFIHAADLHLDSPFIGLNGLPEGNENIVQTLRKATFTAFDNLIDHCVDKKVDFLLIGGDIYDGAIRSLQAQLKFREGLIRLDTAGISSFIVHGNHDPLDGWSHSLKLPSSVHTFGPREESVVFTKNGMAVTRIHGVSYPTRIISDLFGRNLRRTGDEPFQIGLLHCNLGGNTRHENYAPRSIADLQAAGLDYWALGHVHECQVVRVEHPFIGYPGNTQGRQIREAGKRGCFYVSVDEQGRLCQPPEFLETDAVRWLACSLDIGDLADMEELLSQFEREFSELNLAAEGRPQVVRFTLHGRGPIHQDLVRPNAVTDLLENLQSLGAERRPFTWVEKLNVRTHPVIDIPARRAAQDFVGELLGMIQALRESPQLESEMVDVLAELYRDPRAGKLLHMPDREALLALVDAAENRCLDLFLEDED